MSDMLKVFLVKNVGFGKECSCGGWVGKVGERRKNA